MKPERFSLDAEARYQFVKTQRVPDWVTWVVVGVYAIMLLIGVVGPAFAGHEQFNLLAFGFLTVGAVGTLALVHAVSAFSLRKLARDSATVAVDADGYWIGPKFRPWVPATLKARRLLTLKVEAVGAVLLLVAEWRESGEDAPAIVVPFPKDKRELADRCAQHLRSLES